MTSIGRPFVRATSGQIIARGVIVMNRKQRRNVRPMTPIEKAVAYTERKERALKAEFSKETYKIIKDTCDMYSISLAMVLNDKYNQSNEQIMHVLDYVDKLAQEFLENRLSVADCRRSLIDEVGITIGEDATYLPLETVQETIDKSE